MAIGLGLGFGLGFGFWLGLVLGGTLSRYYYAHVAIASLHVNDSRKSIHVQRLMGGLLI